MWMVSTRTGEPAASSGRRDKSKPFMVTIGMSTGTDQSNKGNISMLRLDDQPEQKMGDGGGDYEKKREERDKR